jgi:hypothetical protein
MNDPSIPAAALLLLSLGAMAGWQAGVVRPNLTLPGWQIELAYLLYFVGLPYLAVLGGIITPRLLGLTGLDYFAAIIIAPTTGQIQQAVLLMLLDGLLAAPATLIGGGVAVVIAGLVWRDLHRRGVPGAPLPTLPHLVYLAVHWGVYRAIIWAVTDDLYRATVLGAMVAAVEWAGGYWLARRQWASPAVLSQLMILLLTAAVFYYSPNLWLLLPVHGLLAAIAATQSSPSGR